MTKLIELVNDGFIVKIEPNPNYGGCACFELSKTNKNNVLLLWPMQSIEGNEDLITYNLINIFNQLNKNENKQQNK